MVGYSDGVFTPPIGAITALPKQVIQSAVWNSTYTSMSTALTAVGAVAFEFVMVDSPLSLISGTKGYFEVPLNSTITRWRILSDQVASVTFDIWKVPFASFPPNSGNSITGSAPPILTGAQKSSSSSFTGWNTTLNKGDVLAIVVVSSSGCHQITLSLVCGRN